MSDVSVDVYMIINVYTLCTVNVSMFEYQGMYMYVLACVSANSRVCTFEKYIQWVCFCNCECVCVHSSVLFVIVACTLMCMTVSIE